MKSVTNFYLAFVLLASISTTTNLMAWQVESKSEPTKAQWYKGNLHTHSLWSDGNDFPDMITKWYSDQGYQFLALTDHNILSEGERWFRVADIEKRGGTTALAKYKKAFGEPWVETRKNDKGELEVRLKTLAEYRSKFEVPGKFLLLTGEEISDKVDGLPIHMNATNLSKLLRPAGGKTVREVMTNNLRAAMEQAKQENREILVHLNHPNFGWAVTAEDLAFVTLERFFEVYNGHPSINALGDEKHASVEQIWDIANTLRISKLKEAPLFGLATDDCHYYHGRPGSQPGRGWIMVRADELTPKTLLRSIHLGDFYSSSGVGLKDVSYDKKKRQLRIEIQPVEGETYVTRFIGTNKGFDATTREHTDEDGKPLRVTKIYSDDVGKVLAEVKGTEAVYQLTGDELYVRAIVTSSAPHPNPSYQGEMKQAWTQPVGWKK